MTVREVYQQASDALINEKKKQMLATVVAGPRIGEMLLTGESGCVATDSCLLPWKDAVLRVREDQVISCGDNRLFVEHVKGNGRLVICGAGHIALALTAIARMLGFEITVVDDREDSIRQEKEAGADEVLCGDFTRLLSEMEGGADTYFVILTRGHQYDAQCYREIVKKEYAYVGMIGSKRKIAVTKQKFMEEGVPKEALDRLYAPIGLSIGSQTPEEIAVAIAAQLVMVRQEHIGKRGLTPELLYHLMEDPQACVMALLVKKEGSAPRGVGTRMLVYRDGKTVGTVGGGYTESRILAYARELLEDQKKPQRLVRELMYDGDTPDPEMICGGTIEVFLQRIG